MAKYANRIKNFMVEELYLDNIYSWAFYIAMTVFFSMILAMCMLSAKLGM